MQKHKKEKKKKRKNKECGHKYSYVGKGRK